MSLLNKLAATASDSSEPPKKKMKVSPKQEDKKVRTLDSFLTKDKASSLKKIKKKDLDNSRSDIDTSSSTIVDEIDPKEDIKFQLLPKNPLPDPFLDKRLGFYPDFISFPESERRHFERHWIAYGGAIVKSLRLTDVDFVVHKEKDIQFRKMQKLNQKLSSNVRHVTRDWLIKCINEVALCKTENYAVFVEP